MSSCHVIFKVKFFTEFSETVKILGNLDALGGWNPNLALELKTTPETYPYWETQNPIRLSTGARMEFKLAVFKGS